jgi:hypothetical protein
MTLLGRQQWKARRSRRRQKKRISVGDAQDRHDQDMEK